MENVNFEGRLEFGQLPSFIHVIKQQHLLSRLQYEVKNPLWYKFCIKILFKLVLRIFQVKEQEHWTVACSFASAISYFLPHCSVLVAEERAHSTHTSTPSSITLILIFTISLSWFSHSISFCRERGWCVWKLCQWRSAYACASRETRDYVTEHSHSPPRESICASCFARRELNWRSRLLSTLINSSSSLSRLFLLFND